MKTDSELKKDVLNELLWDPLVPDARVGVSVNGVKAIAMELDVIPTGIHQRSDTEISVDGNVHSWTERNAAEGATWSAPGVTRVKNELTVGA